jgi:hypothetical protein
MGGAFAGGGAGGVGTGFGGVGSLQAKASHTAKTAATVALFKVGTVARRSICARARHARTLARPA